MILKTDWTSKCCNKPVTMERQSANVAYLFCSECTQRCDVNEDSLMIAPAEDGMPLNSGAVHPEGSFQIQEQSTFAAKCIQCLTYHDLAWNHQFNISYKYWLQHELERVNKVLNES